MPENKKSGNKGAGMAAFWCVNFDADPSVLDHGLEERTWLMQYQYSHNGHAYQGQQNQIAATTKNWNAARTIKPGDWLAAHQPGNRFYAVGEVIAPRSRDRHHGQPLHEDSVGRTVREHTHHFLDGIVRYADAQAFYEDFTDGWSRSVVNRHSHKAEPWKYPQRVDVDRWQHVNLDGVEMKGLSKYVPPYKIRLAAFEIPNSFFSEIRTRLEPGSWLSAEEAAPDAPMKEVEYLPQENDRRRLMRRQIRERRGQQQFRDSLQSRYGKRCLISGCEVLAVLEAAHIRPYRGDEDNHPANGLLLRSDLHTLFDLDLLGIEPKGLRVELHPDVVKNYGQFANVVLACGAGKRPAHEALKLRYKQFRRRLHQPG